MLESLGQQVDGRRSSQELFGRVLEKGIDEDKISNTVWKSAITWYMWVY